MKAVLAGSLLAALAVLAWGFVFWATPLSSPAFQTGPDMAGLADCLRTSLPATGTYLVPDPRQLEGDAMQAAYAAGPVAMLFVRSGSVEPMAPAIFVKGYLHMWIACLLLAGLLRLALPALPTYGSRVRLVVLAGVVSAVWANFSEPIWFHHPWGFHLATALYGGVAWLVAGLILARFIRQERAAAL